MPGPTKVGLFRSVTMRGLFAAVVVVTLVTAAAVATVIRQNDSEEATLTTRKPAHEATLDLVPAVGTTGASTCIDPIAGQEWRVTWRAIQSVAPLPPAVTASPRATRPTATPTGKATKGTGKNTPKSTRTTPTPTRPGATGLPGSAAQPGATGFPGSTGQTGTNGQTGANGLPGSNGLPGETALDGETGPPDATGTPTEFPTPGIAGTGTPTGTLAPTATGQAPLPSNTAAVPNPSSSLTAQLSERAAAVTLIPTGFAVRPLPGSTPSPSATTPPPSLTAPATTGPGGVTGSARPTGSVGPTVPGGGPATGTATRTSAGPAGGAGSVVTPTDDLRAANALAAPGQANAVPAGAGIPGTAVTRTATATPTRPTTGPTSTSTGLPTGTTTTAPGLPGSTVTGVPTVPGTTPSATATAAGNGWVARDSDTWLLRWSPTLAETVGASKKETWQRAGTLATLSTVPTTVQQNPRFVTPDGACSVYLAPFVSGTAGDNNAVAVIGDSLVAQLYASEDGTATGTGPLMNRLVTAGDRAEIAGQGGRRWTLKPDAGQPLKAADTSMLDEIRGLREARSVVIALGTNDAGWVAHAINQEQYELRLAWVLMHLAPILDELRDNGHCTVLATMATRNKSYVGSATGRFDEAATRINDYIRVRTGTPADPHDRLKLWDWAAQANSHGNTDPVPWFRADTIHLNPAGHVPYADNLASAAALC